MYGKYRNTEGSLLIYLNICARDPYKYPLRLVQFGEPGGGETKTHLELPLEAKARKSDAAGALAPSQVGGQRGGHLGAGVFTPIA